MDKRKSNNKRPPAKPPVRGSSAVDRKRAAIKSSRRKEWLDAFWQAGIIALVLFFFLWPVRVSGSSMSDKYRDGDRVVMSRVAAYFKSVKRGDVVICSAGDRSGGKDLIKRVMGLPGERVTISGGKLEIDGETIDETAYVKSYTNGDIDCVLGDDEYFLLGDNRAASRDSRDFGAVRRKDLVGKVMFRYFPFFR